ncbi:hypothetical protein [Nocardioides pocheonensis]|uniref:Uncharacterized protein n=1 Tax=Nocardioides pocheonensis TaxID=661485 RepID=A0A3N0GI34_9ACTN|nr:hypothetical protein [Nocardioides pocheonensis]RNM12135.1 hypothetical protein EFL26_20215 [Nocardioides pocheonensis]
MDLSGIIFVVLAVGWAGYLIPKALKHHDDLAMSRPVDTFSDSVRVVGASTKPASRATARAAATTTAAPAATTAEPGPVLPVPPAPVAQAPVPAPRHTISREAARRAARRRRRVLLVLLLALVAVSVTSYLAYTPWWSTAVPGALILVFLVVARLTVRAQQVRRAAPDQSLRTGAPAEAVEPVAASHATAPAEVEPDLGREDTQGFSREELAEAVAAPVLEEGGLWDPLPVTLPTYVTKARARRTVRTIEITGMTSSGHDAADTELARSADEAAKAEAETVADAEAEQRKAAGA